MHFNCTSLNMTKGVCAVQRTEPRGHTHNKGENRGAVLQAALVWLRPACLSISSQSKQSVNVLPL